MPWLLKGENLNRIYGLFKVSRKQFTCRGGLYVPEGWWTFWDDKFLRNLSFFFFFFFLFFDVYKYEKDILLHGANNPIPMFCFIRFIL